MLSKLLHSCTLCILCLIGYSYRTTVSHTFVCNLCMLSGIRTPCWYSISMKFLSYMHICDLPLIITVSGLCVVWINSRLQKNLKEYFLNLHVLGSSHKKHYRIWSCMSQECIVLLLPAISSPCFLEESLNSTPPACKQACYHTKIFPSATDVLWLYLRNDSTYSVVNIQEATVCSVSMICRNSCPGAVLDKYAMYSMSLPQKK